MSGGTVFATDFWATDFFAPGFWTSGAVAPLLVGSISNKSVASNSGSYTYQLGANFLSATSYSISPAVEVGWSFNTGTGEFVIDTDADGLFGPYIVTGINAAGSTPQNAFLVSVGASGENMGRVLSSNIKSTLAFSLTDIKRDY